MRLGEGGFSALDTVNVRLEEEGSLPWTLCQCEAGGGGSVLDSQCEAGGRGPHCPG